MTHWKKMYTGEYENMELIDRKQLLKDMGYNTAEKISESFEDGTISEETTDILSCINGAKVIDPVDIVLEFEKNIEREAHNNP